MLSDDPCDGVAAEAPVAVAREQRLVVISPLFLHPESALDAVSVLSLPELNHVGCVISTAGVATRLPHWIKHLKPETLLCGYDADEAGDTAAQFLIKSHPGIQRIRPHGAKDWNAKLQTIRDTHPRQPSVDAPSHTG